jgi:hypothetical protein
MLFSAKVKVSLVGLVVAGGAAAAIALGPAGMAVGQSSPPTVGQSSPPVQIQEQIQVGSAGTLVAKGAGVDVSVTASCSGPEVVSGTISISLTEAVKGGVASGYGGATIDCTGTTQTNEVLVIAGSGKAFRKGFAIANANINACTVDLSFCASTPVEPEPSITIKK